MKILIYGSMGLALILFSFTRIYAQHDHPATSANTSPLAFSPVFETYLSDPELKKYKMESTLLTIAPGGSDTVAHRHDAELFGYIIEGTVELGLEYKAPVTFNAGQMFYEKRNVIHSSVKNPNEKLPAKVLLITIIKDGRQGYTRLHPEK